MTCKKMIRMICSVLVSVAWAFAVPAEIPFPEFSAPRAVSSSPHEHFLANYFGINAWSPDNRYLLALETDLKDELPDGRSCTVGLVDLEDSNRFIPVMETRTWNFQEAAMAHWLPHEKDTFVVNDLRGGKFVAVVRNWRTGEERVVPHPVSAVSEDGSWALSINYARLYLTRPDYGYAGEGQDPRRGVVFPEDDGLWRVDLKTGEAKLLVSCAALKDMVPHVPETGLSYICHTVISKDMKRIYFLSRSVSQSMEGVKKFKGVNWHTTAFTCSADGSDVRRCFPDGWGSSHFNWKPALSERDARTMIVTCNWQNKVYTHVEFTVGEEDKAHQVGGDAMNFDGHCIYTPDGNFISGDGYWDDKFYRHWKMVRLSDNAVKNIGDFFVPEAYRDVYCRCDLHPRWRGDGRQLAFNSVHEGSRQIYVMDVVRHDEIEPDGVIATGPGFTNRLVRTASGWTDGDVCVSVGDDGCVRVDSPAKGIEFVTLEWRRPWPDGARFLGDAWERSYGDLEWRTLDAGPLFSPWYFLSSRGCATEGLGVETQPNAMCCWKVERTGVSLVLDVRAGGGPLGLAGRSLAACRIVRAESMTGESTWQFGRRFCRMMCPKPRLPGTPVYGYNDWYCAYGKNTATNFLADAEFVVSCAKGCTNPPYVVMDDGWQRNSPPVVGESGRGPWDAAGPNFGMEMTEFCRRVAALGAKPGLWYRPLRAWDELPGEERLLADSRFLDPTVPSVRARIVDDVGRFREWGFKLVKIDFLSFDISQVWPVGSLAHPDRYIQDSRAWRDSSRTTAEVMLDLYKAMKDAAGDEVVIIGCNALNHLAAGVFELQRTGNDTSGKKWEMTRKNGINTLAMRSVQDGVFFKIDADCAGLAEPGAVPWAFNRQWIELLGRSGTPFFVSWKRSLADDEVKTAFRYAFKIASEPRPTGEPLDWMSLRIPSKWLFADGEASYEW